MNPLEARRRLLGRNVYKRTTEGNPAIAQGSLARRYPGITMQGWTEQNGTPTPETSVPIVSAGTQNQDTGKYEYEVKLTGANLFNPDGERVSGLYMGTPIHNKSSVCMQLYEKDPDVDVTGCYIGLSASGIGVEGGLGWALSNGNLNNSGLLVTASMDMYVTWFPVGETILQKIINRYDVMVNIGEQPLPYQPYKEQTVTLTADRPLTKWDKLEKRNGQWGWAYKSEEIESYTDGGVPGEYFSTTGQLSTGAQVWYETTTETFVPLSESEQEQMNELYTFRPTTVLSNDCDCNMSLTYKTKKSLEVTT